ncbi:hypothetical protein J6K27_003456 [Rhodococcus qingshengii]|uniref:hypothetical protein n=1 Tax=Rhodococcus qingshengii TaxID=334542 RepID=UPI001AF007F7|nr:hypothetical protein [Rhodococcus qingshengii]QTR98336.1 hypothetical protein J6K27_003456 [Rhodococcus qingshengii]
MTFASQLGSIDGPSTVSRVLDPAEGAAPAVAVHDSLPGLDATGINDSSQALQDAVNSTLDGSKLIIPPGTYRIDSTINIDNKSIQISCYGCQFTKTTPGKIFNFKASTETVYSVSALTVTTAVEETSQDAVQLTIAGTPNWSRGDIVKLVADDVLVGVRPGSNGNESRTGQFMVVHSSGSDTVELLGTLRDPFTKNIRVARLTRHAVSIEGGTFTHPNTGGVVGFTQFIAPRINNVDITSTNGEAISFNGCVAYQADDIVINYAQNDPANGIYGYGILDNASAYGKVRGLHAMRVRHAFTDDTQRIVENSVALTYYGRTFGATISESRGIACSQSAWSTHAASESVSFVNCDAIDCYTFAGLRGRNHRIYGGNAIDCYLGFNIFSEDMDTDSYGHIVDGLQLIRPKRSYVVEVNLNPVSKEREKRPSHIRNLSVEGMAAPLINVYNGTLRVSGITATAAATLPKDAGVFRLRNAVVEGRGVDVDWRNNTSGATLRFASVEGVAVSELRLDEVAFRFSESVRTRLHRFVSVDPTNTSSVVRLGGVELGGKPVVISDALAPGSYIEWAAGPDSAAYVALATTAIENPVSTAQVAYTSAPQVTMKLHASDGARTLASLPASQRKGQRLVIFSSSTGAVTIPHAMASRIQLAGGVDVKLAQYQSVSLFWDETCWRQN